MSALRPLDPVTGERLEEGDPGPIGLDTGNGELLSLGTKPVHRSRCKPPGPIARWLNGVEAGAVWRCNCGDIFDFDPTRFQPQLHNPGYNGDGWWRRPGPRPEPVRMS